MVQQDVYLFSGTVAENIAYGKPGATRQEIEEAARLAGADGFVRALKDGYDTYVGERGVKLSGGQKQRIAIARVFLKNPPILLLDEATSALDNESEILVGQSLDKLAKGRTTLTIAHRLTTIKNADRILVLGKDGIEEEGQPRRAAGERHVLPPVERPGEAPRQAEHSEDQPPDRGQVAPGVGTGDLGHEQARQRRQYRETGKTAAAAPCPSGCRTAS